MPPPSPLWLSNNGGAVASDACGGVTWSHNSTGLSDLPGATGAETVIFTATDDCGNTSTPRPRSPSRTITGHDEAPTFGGNTPPSTLDPSAENYALGPISDSDKHPPSRRDGPVEPRPTSRTTPPMTRPSPTPRPTPEATAGSTPTPTTILARDPHAPAALGLPSGTGPGTTFTLSSTSRRKPPPMAMVPSTRSIREPMQGMTAPASTSTSKTAPMPRARVVCTSSRTPSMRGPVVSRLRRLPAISIATFGTRSM